MSSHTNRWVKCISKSGTVRGVAVEATELVQSLVAPHQLTEAGIKALGEAVVGAIFFASYCKAGGRVNLNIKGSGVMKQVFVDATPDGRVRGYGIERPKEQYLFQEPIRGFWGEGFLSVLRTKENGTETPYVGTVPLVTGQLAKDLTFYWLQSEQIPSAVGVSVTVKDGKILTAGGFLVQAMPGCTDEEVQAIEEHVFDFAAFEKDLAQNRDPVRLLSRLFQDSEFILLEETPLFNSCTCTQEKVERALAFVGVDELRDMIEQDGKASLRCDFCTKEYFVDLPTLKRLAGLAKA